MHVRAGQRGVTRAPVGGTAGTVGQAARRQGSSLRALVQPTNHPTPNCRLSREAADGVWAQRGPAPAGAALDARLQVPLRRPEAGGTGRQLVRHKWAVSSRALLPLN